MNRLLPIALMALAAFVVSGCAGSGYYYAGAYSYDPYWPFRHYYYPYFHHFRMPWPRFYPYPLRPWPGYRRPYRHRPVPRAVPQPSYYRSDLQPETPGVSPGGHGEWHRRGSGQHQPGGGGSAVTPGGRLRNHGSGIGPSATPGARYRERARERAAPPFRVRSGDGERSRSGSPPARTVESPRPRHDGAARPRFGGGSGGGGHRSRRP
jgi:hypothetical protein